MWKNVSLLLLSLLLGQSLVSPFASELFEPHHRSLIHASDVAHSPRPVSQSVSRLRFLPFIVTPAVSVSAPCNTLALSISPHEYQLSSFDPAILSPIIV